MANKYIFQLRRGVRYVDDNGATLLGADGEPVRDDWTTYTAQPNHMNPLDGELVVEFEYNPTTGKKTPRFKLGYDDNIFANLEYISPDSFILPKPAQITLKKNNWTKDVADNRWYQEVTVVNATITSNTKVDLQPSAEDLCTFSTRGFAFVAENVNGVVNVYCIGNVPTDETDPDGVYNIPVTVTNVTTVDGVDRIVGDTTTTINNAIIEDNVLVIK
jgi:hypothetical protein